MNICIPNTMAAYLRNLPIVMLVTVMGRLERISPSSTVIALPITGRKAKKAIHAPLPCMNLCARSMFFCLMWRYFSIQSILPKVPIQ